MTRILALTADSLCAFEGLVTMSTYELGRGVRVHGCLVLVPKDTSVDERLTSDVAHLQNVSVRGAGRSDRHKKCGVGDTAVIARSSGL